VENWAESAESGSRDTLDFEVPPALWSLVCSDAENCMGPQRCAFSASCFVQRLRREAAGAAVIVVNHHLLFADIAAREEGAGWDAHAVLPPYRRVIIDEAHTIEAAATSFFSDEFSRPGLLRTLGRLIRERAGLARSGLLPVLADALDPSDSGNRVDKWAREALRVREALSDLDAAALALCGGERSVFRLVPGRRGLLRERLAAALTVFEKRLAAFASSVKSLAEEAEARAEEDKLIALQAGPVLWEVKSLLKALRNTLNVAGKFSSYINTDDDDGESEDVLWLERRVNRGREAGDPGYAVFNVTPLSVAGRLRASLFSQAETVVCLSATLTVGGSFGNWASRVGLAGWEEREALTGVFPSPFPYERRVLLCVPEKVPLPGDDGYQDYVNEAVYKLASIAGGSSLALFTSFESLLSAYNHAAPLLEGEGIHCLRQGEEDRSRLLRRFLEDETSVLFATDSFWEGIDAPGDTLRLVIMARLPFRTPNDPVFEARCEKIDSSGGNSFMALSVPEAVIKFRQGFGRLMRRSADRGVVTILDGRLRAKRYGQVFLRSLPKTQTLFASLEAIIRAVERFFYA